MMHVQLFHLSTTYHEELVNASATLYLPHILSSASPLTPFSIKRGGEEEERMKVGLF